MEVAMFGLMAELPTIPQYPCLVLVFRVIQGEEDRVDTPLPSVLHKTCNELVTDHRITEAAHMVDDDPVQTNRLYPFLSPGDIPNTPVILDSQQIDHGGEPSPMDAPSLYLQPAITVIFQLLSDPLLGQGTLAGHASRLQHTSKGISDP